MVHDGHQCGAEVIKEKRFTGESNLVSKSRYTYEWVSVIFSLELSNDLHKTSSNKNDCFLPMPLYTEHVDLYHGN